MSVFTSRGVVSGGADRGLRIWPTPITGDTGVAPGFLFLVESGADELTISLNPEGPAAGQSFAFKSQGTTDAEAADIMLVAPLGALMEDDEGFFADVLEIERGRAAGTYREWLCAEDGITWVLRHHHKIVEEAATTFPFTLRVTSTHQTASEVIGYLQFEANDWRAYTTRFVAHLEVAGPDQTATLDLHDYNSGELLASVSSSQTLAELVFVWFTPNPDVYSAFYEIRLRCSGGDASRRAFCRTAGIEIR